MCYAKGLHLLLVMSQSLLFQLPRLEKEEENRKCGRGSMGHSLGTTLLSSFPLPCHLLFFLPNLQSGMWMNNEWTPSVCCLTWHHGWTNQIHSFGLTSLYNYARSLLAISLGFSDCFGFRFKVFGELDASHTALTPHLSLTSKSLSHHSLAVPDIPRAFSCWCKH